MTDQASSSGKGPVPPTCSHCGATFSYGGDAYCGHCGQARDLASPDPGQGWPLSTAWLLGSGLVIVVLIGFFLAGHNRDNREKPMPDATDQVKAADQGNVGRLIGVHPAENSGGDVNCVVFTPDGKHVLTGSQDQTIILWDLASGRETKRFGGKNPQLGVVRALAVAPDGLRMLSGSGSVMRLWDLSSGRITAEYSTKSPKDNDVFLTQLNYVAFSPDGNQAIACGAETFRTAHRLFLWDLDTPERPRVLTAEGMDNVTSVKAAAVHPDGSKVITGDWGGNVFVWDIEGGNPIRHIKCEGSIQTIGITRDGLGVLLATSSGCCFWNLASKEEPRKFDEPSRMVFSAALSPHGDRAVSSEFTSGSAPVVPVTLFDVQSGHAIDRLTGHDRTILSLAFSPDGSQVVGAATGGKIYLWNLRKR